MSKTVMAVDEPPGGLPTEGKCNFPLSDAQKKSIHDYLDRYTFTKTNYEYSYQFWAKGGRGWNRTFATGGTYIMKALMWYHHKHKSGSEEWRPTVIMTELCQAAGLTR